MNLRSLPRQFRFRWQRVVGALLGILLILTVTSWLWITGKAYQTPVPASLDTYALLVTSKDWVYEGTPRLPVVIAWIPILAVLVILMKLVNLILIVLMLLLNQMRGFLTIQLI